jgi:bifunctional non-homologous end joining protein LigD
VVVESLKRPFSALAPEEQRRLRRSRPPRTIVPMLATLTDRHFSDPGWIFERKLDGVRCLAFRSGERVRIVSRNALDMTATWPEITAALAKQPCGDFVVDGEIVAFDGKATSFSRLQGRLGVRNPGREVIAAVPVELYVFDVLHADGYDTTALSQLARKQLLSKLLRFGRNIRYTEHRAEHGLEFLDAACSAGWEGLIAKKADAPYVSQRSRNWLKFKCEAGQELVIGGYTDPQGARSGFGALLVGYYDRGKLHYAGKVGTGYSHEMLRTLSQKLRRLARPTCPFATTPRERGAHWVEPELVGEFGFTEWTADGKLRHPRFFGLRADKKATSVRRERASLAVRSERSKSGAARPATRTATRRGTAA